MLTFLLSLPPFFPSISNPNSIGYTRIRPCQRTILRNWFLSLVALGLHCCTRASSSCGERGSPCWSRRAARCGGFWWSTGPAGPGSGAVARGLGALRRVGSSQTKDGTLSSALAGGFPFTVPPSESWRVLSYLFSPIFIVILLTCNTV